MANMKAAAVFVMILFGCMNMAKEAAALTQDANLLYRAKCTACHRVYPPKNYTYHKLQTYAATYGKGLNDEDRRKLLEYLKENAKQ